MSLRKPTTLDAAAESGRLEEYLKRYLRECRPPSEGESKKPTGRFPNLAGFCRWLGCGTSRIETLRLSHPEAADRLIAVMEDEALNFGSGVSPTLLTAYLKRRLGYASERAEAVAQAECGEMRVIFEHDIEEDGA